MRNEHAIQAILAAPAVQEGERHADILRRTHQLRANGMGRGETVQAISSVYPIGTGEHRPITSKEIEDAWDGAPADKLEPWLTRNGRHLGQYQRYGNRQEEPQKPEVRPYKHDGSKCELPKEQDISWSDFLHLFLGFRDDEYAWFGIPSDYGTVRQDLDGKLMADFDKLREDGSCLDYLTGKGFDERGTYVVVNPLKSGDARKQENVSRYLYTLVEHDKLPKEEQLAIYKKLNLPIAALIDSGGKSLHAIVKIEASDLKQYQERVAMLHKRLAGLGFDNGKDAVRFTRMPNCPRGESRQSLRAVNIGASCWLEWEATLEIDDGKRKLQGMPLLDYLDLEIPEEDTLLGNRWLCRGGGAFIVAPSGQGKSVLSIQAAIEWSCGRSSFGIKPQRPLKVLVIQAEDHRGDLKEMAQIARYIGLSDAELALCHANVHMEPINDLTGTNLLQAVDGFLDQFPADLLILNPYSSYNGCEVKDDGLNNAFLRNTLNPLLTKHNCPALNIHHTPKTNFVDTTNWKPSDWMYRGAGAACLTNWARAILVVDPTPVLGTYKFIAAKRGKRIGWGYEYPVFETFWSWSQEDGKLLWVPASETEIKAGKKKEKTEDDLLEILPLGAELTRDQIKVLAKGKLKIGEKTTDRFINVLDADGKIAATYYKRKGKRDEVKYSKKELAAVADNGCA